MDKQRFFFEHYGLTERDLERYLAAALSAGGDYADLYFEYVAASNISLEESIVKDAVQGVTLGVGVRVISGERTGYAYSDDLSPEKIRKAFRDYVTSRLPGDCRCEFLDHAAAPAIALDWNMKPLAAAKKALTEEWGKETVLFGSGASIPIVADFKKSLGLDTLLVGFGLDDDNIHSPNEKYDLKSFHKGIRSWARIIAALSQLPR